MLFRTLFLCLFLASPLAAVEKPNVLFISIDDLNDWIGCLKGHPQVKTPHIDQLAAEGVNFTNAHCQAPICNPSRISMMLGKLPSTSGHYFLAPGFRDVEVTRNSETIFQTFRKNGYFVSTRGKIFHGKPDEESFDHIEAPAGWRRPGKKLHYTIPGSHPAWDWGEIDVPDEEQRDYKTAAWAADQIPTLNEGEKPWFLAIGFHLPHVPIYASKKWFDLYPLDTLQNPPILQTDRDDIPEVAQDLTANFTAPRHEWMVQNGEDVHAVRAYLAANSFIDHLVGMILKSLDESGSRDNTVVMLWSDHGFHLGEKLRWAKRTLWEETTRVPFIIAGPGVVEGLNCSRPVGLIDAYPTLLEMCGLPEKVDLEGQSLLPLLKDPDAEWKTPALTTFGPHHHSIRSEDYRYTSYADGSQELYSHKDDPNEWKNLAGDPQYADIIAQHREWLPTVNVDPVPGSRGSDSPLYGEGGGLQKAMKRKK